MAEQSGRSLRLAAAEQTNANTALLKFGSKRDLAADLKMSPTTITNFFARRPVQRKEFHTICKKLKFDWQPESATPQSNAVNADIDELVREVRDLCCNRILAACNSITLYTLMRIDLEQLFVPIFVSQEPSSQRESSQKNLPLSPALEIVNRHQHLMILGKPGAGKSTFATYLSITCCEDESKTDWIPVLLRLIEVETRTPFKLLDALGTTFDTEPDITQKILKSGKVFLILDGLDEVSSQFRQDICQEISNFVTNPYANKIVITCRTDLKNYKLSSFDRVEIADFDETQQNQFIENWFSIADKAPTSWLVDRLKQHPECTSRTLINHFQDNQHLQELAKTPILLSLICLVYVSDGDLPEKRSSLYERGLGILLEQWDENRRIENRVESIIYNSLSSDDKRKILGQLARHTFDQVENIVVFEQATALKIIANYRNYSPQESLEILEGIAADHGLLFRSAWKKWEFSHLTFQEYFVAQWFVQYQEWETLAKNVCNPRWREVFLLTTEMADPADKLLTLMKHRIDELLVEDNKLQKFLQWVDEKARSIDTSYEPAAMRAFYLSSAKALTSAFDDAIKHGNYNNLKTNLDMSLVSTLDENFRNHYFGFRFDGTHVSDFDFYDPWILIFDLLITLNSSPLEEELKELKMQLPDFNERREIQLTWLINDGERWREKFRSVISEGSWQFSDTQNEKLQQYYDANKLLVDCLNSDRCIDDSNLQKEIEEALLLPISEIEKRRKPNVS